MDGPTFSEIEAEIRDTVALYLPNIILTNISIAPASEGEEDKGYFINDNNEKEFRVPGISQAEHTAKIKIDYLITDTAFNSSDFIIINI